MKRRVSPSSFTCKPAEVLTLYFAGALGLSLQIVRQQNGFVLLLGPEALQDLLYNQLFNHGMWYRDDHHVAFELQCFVPGHEGTYCLQLASLEKVAAPTLTPLGAQIMAAFLGPDYTALTAAQTTLNLLMPRWKELQADEEAEELGLISQLHILHSYLVMPDETQVFVAAREFADYAEDEEIPLNAPPNRCHLKLTFLDGSQLWLTSQGPLLQLGYDEPADAQCVERAPMGTTMPEGATLH